ncbi:hypothetical protein AAG906_019902 [Vitis piasezkii]
MGRPCTHESLGGKQGKPGGLVVQTRGAYEPPRRPWAQGHGGWGIAKHRTLMHRQAQCPAPRGTTMGAMTWLRTNASWEGIPVISCVPCFSLLVSEQAPEMAGGSAMEALRERMTQLEEAMGEWPREDGTVASWAENTTGELHLQRSLLESHDNFFEEKLGEFKTEMQSRIEEFKETLRRCCRDLPQARKPPPKFESLSPRASMVNEGIGEFLVGHRRFFKVLVF